MKKRIITLEIYVRKRRKITTCYNYNIQIRLYRVHFSALSVNTNKKKNKTESVYEALDVNNY